MHEPFFGPIASGLGFGAVLLALLFLIIALWSLAWKSLGLWHAARNKQRLWFLAILLFNTVGILEIVYLVWFRKDENNNGSKDLYPFFSIVRERMASEPSSAPAEKEKVAEEKNEIKDI